MSGTFRCLPALALLLGLAACGGAPDPVARLDLEDSPGQLAHPRYDDVVLRWQVGDREGRPQGQLAFVHLLDGEGKVVRTFDHELPGTWRPGAVIEDRIDLFQSALGPPLAAGTYPLTVGLLDAGGERLPLEISGPELGRLEYRVAEIVVPRAPSDVRFAFEGNWEDREPGSDRQILGRRWFDRRGRILVEGAGPGDRVLLWLRIPDPAEHRSQFVLDEGGMLPEVEVSTPCDQEAIRVSGLGLHRLEMRLGERQEGRCALDVVANYFFVDPTRDGRERSAVVEVLAFRVGEAP